MNKRYEPRSIVNGEVPESPGGSDHFLCSDGTWVDLTAAVGQAIDAAIAGATPPGLVGYFPYASAPAGWIKANGALLSRTTYADLFAAAEADGLVTESAWSTNSWGRFSVGDGSTTFRIPDLRGEFIRSWDDGRGIDSGRSRGVLQSDAFRSHTHATSPSGTLLGNNGSGTALSSGSGTAVNYGTSIASTGGAETRPRNQALLACLKY